jgi:hypothetical protein
MVFATLLTSELYYVYEIGFCNVDYIIPHAKCIDVVVFVGLKCGFVFNTTASVV